MSQNLSSATVVIGTLRIKWFFIISDSGVSAAATQIPPLYVILPV